MRIQFKVSEQQGAEINKLMERTGSTTRRELLTSALAVLRWVVDEKHNGNSISSISKDGSVHKELAMPVIDNLLSE